MKYQIFSLAVAACLLVGVAAFSATDKQELKKAQDELAKTKAVLADIQKENEALKAEVARLEKQQASEKVIRERDDAIQAAAGYQADYANALDQLEQQAQRNLILQQQVYDLQSKMTYLLHRLDGATVMPSPGWNNCFVMPSPTYSGF
jgi:septal ring factor EnvC (AmiA/AmiB activator)